ncbi:hypothetical protein pb186bvf_003417 [Paramecium bursaria]
MNYTDKTIQFNWFHGSVFYKQGIINNIYFYKQQLNQRICTIFTNNNQIKEYAQSFL